MRLIAVHLPERIIEDIQRLVNRGLYPNRSEAIRIAVREALSEFTLQRLKREQVVATITAISDRERHDLNSRLMDLRHEFDESIFGNMHLHIGKGYCVETFILREEPERVLDFVSRVRAFNGIREVKYAMTPIEE